MYEELIRCLRDCWDESTGPTCDCDHCLFREHIVEDGDFTVYQTCETAMVLAAAHAIEDLENKLNLWRQDKISRWIPVTERLPKDRRDVQITVFWHDAWRTMYGYFDGAFWHLYAPMHTEVADVEVIGWMEKPKPMHLPKPPKEET